MVCDKLNDECDIYSIILNGMDALELYIVVVE